MAGKKRKAHVEPSSPSRYYRLFEEATAEVERLFGEMSRRAKSNQSSPIPLALTIASTLGVRHLRSAESLIRSGWIPEARMPLRAAWEVMIDMAFLLSGVRREFAAKRYVALSLLRYPKLMTKNPPPPPREFVEALARLGLQAAMDDFGSDKGIKAEHWSALDKKTVRQAAGRYLEAELPRVDRRGRRYVAGLIDKTREGIFNTGSAIVHSDPAGYWLTTPGESDLTRRVLPRPGEVGFVEPSIACTVAILMGIPLGDRLKQRDTVHRLFGMFDQLLRRG